MKLFNATSAAHPPEQSSTGVARALRLLMAVLREIFDESAYSRFLKRGQLAPSRAAYAAFYREYEVVKARRPRCC